ncbi:glycoside hydrolase family 55 protein [Paxillus involutus ATCC 200175]|uniref:Glycoside hydrolase family 55 protein n=1 Tax=Paxillus involutus ATCC 200175 TaxID=664439 RepID=A0A0C9U6M9_PAXIN|nr:glycoside hydrolase family 55 protein [Paxillus involutus ATCC 200175]
MYVQSSSDIILFCAGFYTFFRNYDQTCLATNTCQTQIFDMDSDSASSVTVYSLSTVGASYQLSVGLMGVVKEGDNPDVFQETVTVWST